MTQGASMATTGALIRDTSEGQVGPRSNGMASIQYDINEQDRTRLIKGLHYGARLWLEGHNAKSVASSVFGAPMCHSMSDVKKAVPHTLNAERLIPYSSHPQASCRIGRALDHSGKLIGSKSVYVMDASALPSNVGRNPQISIMTVCRILSKELASDLGYSAKPLL